MKARLQYVCIVLAMVGVVCVSVGAGMSVIKPHIASRQTISNVVPRKDTMGNIMDIHDGNTFLLNGVYYYYGASYGLCTEPSGSNGCADFGFGNCGFQLNHNVSLYTSPDLAHWTFQGHIFQMQQDFNKTGILFCPKVLYNPLTKMFVLWFNWIDESGGWSASYYAVATSKTPLGPFTVVSQQVTTLAYQDTGDFNLFYDDTDGSAYIIYTSEITNPSANHRMSVEKLDPTFTRSLGSASNSGFFGSYPVEAPAYFERNGTYYAVFGSTCCYCGGGAPVNVYSATNPLGPYTMMNGLGGAIPAQQTNIAKWKKAGGGYGYLWQGDRWQSAPDRLKGHDFSYWTPMDFDAKGTVQPFTWEDSFVIDVSG